jgi:hypothetical protein
MTASDRVWRPTAARLPECGCDHGGAPGTFDERARRVNHDELAAAELLVAEGHAVRSLPEPRGHGPRPDFDVCGLLVEVKTLVPQDERPGRRPANDRSAYNRLLSGIDQAPVTLLMTQGSGLRPADAAAGMQRFAMRPRAGKTLAVRIVGDGWDLAWKAPVGLERAGGPSADHGRRRTAPATDRPVTDRPVTDRPVTDRPVTDRPATKPQERDRPSPGLQTPDRQTPDRQPSDRQPSDRQPPDRQTSDRKIPGRNAPARGGRQPDRGQGLGPV